MCALLYYLCLMFSLLHFFLPLFFFFLCRVFNHLESRASFCVSRGRQLTGFHLVACSVVGRGLPKPLHICHQSFLDGKTVTSPMSSDFWEHLEINHSCGHMFIIANPADTLLSTFQKNTNTDLFSLCAWVQVAINLLGIKLASVVMNTETCKVCLDFCII